MKALILAGGFGARMGPLAGQIPKAMIVVEGETILDHLLKKLEAEGVEPIITTNRKFEHFFRGYKNVLIEEARAEEEKPGAVSAINRAIRQLGIEEDLMVVCGDNYFSSDFRGFLASYTGEPLIGVYYVGGKLDMRPEEMGTMRFEGSEGPLPPGRSFYLDEFGEKVKPPLSDYVGVGLYIFPKSIFPLLDEFCEEAKRDAPGFFIQHLLERGVKLKGYLFGGEWRDVSHMYYLKAMSAGRLVKSDDRYIVCDLGLGNLVLSMTILHPGKQTTGHSHAANEVYFFLEGEGKIEMDGVMGEVRSKDVIVIPPNRFHRIYNTSKKGLIFLSVFEKYGERG